jgi:hypothetical protein
MNKHSQFALVAILLSLSASAVETRFWSLGDAASMDKGVLRKLALRSDGVVTLAPRSREAADAALPYLLALAADSKGNVYMGGGPGASRSKLLKMDSSGKVSTLAEVDGLQIQALAVDASGRVYAATAPEGKVWRVSSDGKAEVFYEPKARYIWALTFDRGNDLLVATGEPAAIHRVNSSGRGGAFFTSEETHVRSLAVDASGFIYAGTDPGGLVLRVDAKGEGFVLFQSSRREVTALDVDGQKVYALISGLKGSGNAAAAVPAPVVQLPVAGPQPQGAANARPVAPVAPLVTAAPPGGAELVRLENNAAPQVIWTSATEFGYCVKVDEQGKPIIGTGNRGQLIRVDSPVLSTRLLTLNATQITALHRSNGGRMLVATGNTGRVFELGPGAESEGALESQVFDSGSFANWGKMFSRVTGNGGLLMLEARSGNQERTQSGWSAWTPLDNGRIVSPAARYLQFRATMKSSGTASPELLYVDAAYLTRNLPPRMEMIDITPANYRFPATSTYTLGSGNPASLNLPTLSRSGAIAPLPALDLSTSLSTPTMTWARGSVGARWLAGDANNDTMEFRVEIRGEKESDWKLLREKVTERYLSFDSSAFADGRYRLRVTASDAPGNLAGTQLTDAMESDYFTIDNTAPLISGLAASPAGGNLALRWKASDALNNIRKAEYSLNGGDWVLAEATTKLNDALELDYSFTVPRPTNGEVVIAVRVADDNDNHSVMTVLVK